MEKYGQRSRKHQKLYPSPALNCADSAPTGGRRPAVLSHEVFHRFHQRAAPAVVALSVRTSEKGKALVYDRPATKLLLMRFQFFSLASLFFSDIDDAGFDFVIQKLVLVSVRQLISSLLIHDSFTYYFFDEQEIWLAWSQ
jgi:hypothetical protein